MYLPQAASLPPSIGAQPDLFRCMHLVWESWFEPTVAASGTVVACATELFCIGVPPGDWTYPQQNGARTALTWWYG